MLSEHGAPAPEAVARRRPPSKLKAALAPERFSEAGDRSLRHVRGHEQWTRQARAQEEQYGDVHDYGLNRGTESEDNDGRNATHDGIDNATNSRVPRPSEMARIWERSDYRTVGRLTVP